MGSDIYLLRLHFGDNTSLQKYSGMFCYETGEKAAVKCENL